MLWGEENAEQHILCDYPQEMRERSRTWSCQQFLTFLLPEIKTKKKSPIDMSIFKTQIPRPCPKSTES